MEQTTTQRRIADRRRLWDRRSGDRPSSTGDDRRAAATRRGRERRCTTPIPYSPEQQAELQIRFAASGPVSCPACGGTFTLGPAHRASGRIERLVLCVSCRRGTVIEDGAAARVLVVSAVAPLRGLLREMLIGAGHEVIEADDAAVGLDAYGAIPADVVIVDVLATGRLGAQEFLSQLRQAHPDARVAALAGRSSYAGADPRQVVEGLTEVRTLRVPLSREALLKTVQELRG